MPTGLWQVIRGPFRCSYSHNTHVLFASCRQIFPFRTSLPLYKRQIKEYSVDLQHVSDLQIQGPIVIHTRLLHMSLSIPVKQDAISIAPYLDLVILQDLLQKGELSSLLQDRRTFNQRRNNSSLIHLAMKEYWCKVT